jgi:glycosyltransferase involved in cell wall biosynthesis
MSAAAPSPASVQVPEALRGKHIAVVEVRWPPETFLALRYRALVQAGLRVSVFTAAPRTGAAIAGVAVERASDWRTLASFTPGAVRRLLASWHPDHDAKAAPEAWPQATIRRVSIAAKVARLLRVRPDVIHFEWNAAAASYLPWFELFGCPVVISCRGAHLNILPLTQGDDYQARLARSLQRAAAVHCVSNAIREQACRYGLARERTTVIRPAVDARFFVPGPATVDHPGPVRIITTGSLIWRKGHEYLVHAVALLNRAGVAAQLQIVGAGPDKQQLLHCAGDLGIADRVELVGARSPEQVRDLLQAADVFALASLSEGIANSALEAMATGLPVVVTDCGGMTEVIDNGVEGLIVPRWDAPALAAALHALAGNRDLRLAMGALGRQRVLRELTIEHQTQAFIDLYGRVLGAPC